MHVPKFFFQFLRKNIPKFSSSRFKAMNARVIFQKPSCRNLSFCKDKIKHFLTRFRTVSQNRMPTFVPVNQNTHFLKIMKKALLFGLVQVFSLTILLAQTTFKGKITDEDSKEPVIGVNIKVLETSIGAVTDVDGNFSFQVEGEGSKTLEFSFIGYTSLTKEVELTGGEVDLGEIIMASEAIGLEGVEVIASVAIDRKTPVAVSTIKGSVIAEQVGNQEFPEILNNTPSVYVTKSGGGFGDSRINVRGFDQRNTAVMINGVPVNDMENGWVYWSNWAGLSDVTSQMQVQRGLGASKLAVASVGGSINIITNATDLKKGGAVGVSVGNDGYQKYSLVGSTGLTKSGFAATVQLTHTAGDGYVDGTKFRAYSYFLSLSQKLGNHLFSVTYLGAPQWHHQRTVGSFDGVTLRSYVDPDNTGEKLTNMGIRFNHNYGTLNGEEFSWRRNFYHKPKGFVNHYWTISEKTELSTSAYISTGRGGGTGPRGRLRTAGSIFDTDSRLRDENGQVRFDDIVKYNQGQNVEPDLWGVKQQFNGQYATTSDGRYYFADGSNSTATSGLIRRASMNSHNWYGVLSTLTSELSDKLTLVAGIDGRYYRGIHYRRLDHLLGNDAYIARGDKNNPENYITKTTPSDFGSFADNDYQNTGNQGTNILNYYNDGLVQWLGLFTQLEYSTDNLTWFASLSGSNQGFKRIDYFNYAPGEQESEWQNFMGGTIKTGLNYNINDNHNVFGNVGYFSRQPIFDNVFINFRNDINPDIENQAITAFELGYGYRSAKFNANVNLYSTTWANRQFDRTQQNAANQDINYLFRNVAETHRGIEIEANYNPTNKLRINGMISLGDWFYNNNFTATGTNLDTQQSEGELTIFAKGLEVGDAAQTTMSLGANYEITKGLRLNLNWRYADRLFAQYDVNERQFLQEGGKIAQLPSYSLMDAGLYYTLKLKNKSSVNFQFNMNNILDEIYVAELDTNILDDPSTPRNEFYDNRGFYGFGRTWNFGVKFKF